RSSRKRRKQRQRAAGEPSTMARGYARGRAKDEAARAALEPLAEGERPGIVTVAAVIAFALGAANLISYLAGVEVQGEQPAFSGILVYSGLMFTVAYGCFRARYWGVLGMQAMLALAILIFGVLLTRAESVVALLIALAVIGGAGTVFWKLVKAMARIQMPERPGADR
ncbi:MAG TPA: hypothetical protein VHF90_01675, partial [Thermoleophilaceae bacterium]|nr:hypothetical protein [Thermoleophilaceae bacterium]